MKKHLNFLICMIVLAGMLSLSSGCKNNPAGADPDDPGTMVLIQAAGDSFDMGDGTYGPIPPLSQTISHNLLISSVEVTNQLFAEFIAHGGYTTESYWTANGWSTKVAEGWSEPEYWNDPDFNQPDQAVVGVSWYEAVAFCNWLSEQESLDAAYDANGLADLSASGYRLPTEVEWEYAAAKGASGDPERLYPMGNVWDGTKVVCNVAPESASAPAAVGSKSPGGDTPQGLKDMNGNVWEWLSDNYQDKNNITPGTDYYYFSNDDTATFLVRGGSCLNISTFYFQCSYRTIPGPRADSRNTMYGFRILRRQ